MVRRYKIIDNEWERIKAIGKQTIDCCYYMFFCILETLKCYSQTNLEHRVGCKIMQIHKYFNKKTIAFRQNKNAPPVQSEGALYQN